MGTFLPQLRGNIRRRALSGVAPFYRVLENPYRNDAAGNNAIQKLPPFQAPLRGLLALEP